MLPSPLLLFVLIYAAAVDGSIIRQRRCVGTGCVTTTTRRVTKVITETTYVDPPTTYVQPTTYMQPPPRPPCYHPWCHRRRHWGGWYPPPPMPPPMPPAMPMPMCSRPPCYW
ncbi:unnamed protein product [Cylicocyclus nassatus]|uniref:Uncharacterized protein n=1 Tax=Cylicocyclus nassatus TaxID=53992 RepID=A0AA36HFP2_CYLNA|nr:unnamed protein product [Cylicocyclus nassatus]